MATIQDQKKLTGGKGWKRESPYKVGLEEAKALLKGLRPETFKKVGEKIQKIKDKKKRGPRDE